MKGWMVDNMEKTNRDFGSTERTQRFVEQVGAETREHLPAKHDNTSGKGVTDGRSHPKRTCNAEASKVNSFSSLRGQKRR